MSYAVRQRMREIGTRVALGATPSSILWLVLGQGARVAVIGTLIGLVTALTAGRVLRGLLFSTTPGDPLVLSAAAGLLLATTLAACYSRHGAPRESILCRRSLRASGQPARTGGLIVRTACRRPTEM